MEGLLRQIPVSGQEIINNILDGLSPVQRSRFVLETRLSSWADIGRLCVHDRSLSFADSNRQLEGFVRHSPYSLAVKQEYGASGRPGLKCRS
jgi:hypothetical protein